LGRKAVLNNFKTTKKTLSWLGKKTKRKERKNYIDPRYFLRASPPTLPKRIEKKQIAVSRHETPQYFLTRCPASKSIILDISL